MFQKVILFAGCLCVTLGFEIQNSYEFEDALTPNQATFRSQRSQALGDETLRLEDTNETHLVTLTLCNNQTQDISLQIDDIRYSNDGGSDTIRLKMNNQLIGLSTTQQKSDDGNGWNVFRNTGPIGTQVTLPQGESYLKISVITDQYGAELDSIRINAEVQSSTTTLICGASFN